MFKYDLFISYAHEDRTWVRQELFGPLERCRSTATGEKLRIFIDDGPLGIRPARSWITELTDALTASRRIILVFSSTYFEKPMCQWELEQAFRRSPNGADGTLVPIVIEPAAADAIPPFMSLIQHLRVSQDDWFPVLCQTLGVSPPRPPLTLQFQGAPTNVIANHTLPAVRVSVAAGAGLVDDEEVTLAGEGVALQGTLSQRSVGGVATFPDLSVGVALPRMRLFAYAAGGAVIVSEPFAVLPAPKPVLPVLTEPVLPGREPSIIAGGVEPIFFGEAEGLAVLTDERLVVYDAAGQETSRVELRAPVRLVRVGPRTIGLADWAGNVTLASADGPPATWSLATDGGVVPVLGSLWLDPTDADSVAAYAGLWDGRVLRLVGGDAAPREVFHHPGGVQALTGLGGRLYVYDLDRRLCVYENGACLQQHQVEPVARLLKAYDDCVVAAGEQHIYSLWPIRTDLFHQPLRLDSVVAACDAADLPVLIDRRGKGVQIDHTLHIPVLFHTVAGALPLSMDRRGRYCVLKNPDGSRCLMEQGRIVYSQPGGTLAVAPDGARVALGDGREIRILPIASLVESSTVSAS